MAKKKNNIISAIMEVGEERQIPASVVVDALQEAMVKAYKKDAGIEDLDVTAKINPDTNNIDLYQNYKVVEAEDENFDDEVEMTLAEARKLDPNAQVGGTVKRLIEIEDKTALSRAAAMLAKNVMQQKIREAEKDAVYNEYVDHLKDMVTGTVESVKDRFALVNIGRTVAMMPRSAQIPGEVIREGDSIKVVISEVNRETKGSQVLVSRADPMLVKRLFEKEVPEIYQGIVEIKAIAREPGERTKMAVLSHNPEVDPIGACIGPRGTRVQAVSEEICNEKIDIFRWSDDLTELVRNALAPAEIEAVVPGKDEKSLLVVVSPNELSLAIGKRGKNARLAVKLTNHKIDIKTREELEEEGYDYDELMAKADEMKAAYRRKAEAKEAENRQAVIAENEERRQEAVAKFAAKNGTADEPEEDIIPEEMQEVVSDKVLHDIAMEDEPKQEEEKPVETAPAEETASEEQQEPAIEEEQAAEPAEETEIEEVPEETEEEPQDQEEEEKTEVKKESSVKKEGRTDSHRHADLEKMAAQNTYVSVFEKLADTSKPKQETKKRKHKKTDEDNYKLSNKELEKQLKLKKEAAKPVYTDEELAEIEAQQEAEEESEYDIDYDEYEDYYDDEDNN